MARIGLLAFTTALTLAGASYGEPITLTCSGMVHAVAAGGRSQDTPFSPTGLTIDVEGGKVVWGADTLPITSNKGNFVTFQGRHHTKNQQPKGDGVDNLLQTHWDPFCVKLASAYLISRQA